MCVVRLSGTYNCSFLITSFVASEWKVNTQSLTHNKGQTQANLVCREKEYYITKVGVTGVDGDDLRAAQAAVTLKPNSMTTKSEVLATRDRLVAVGLFGWVEPAVEPFRDGTAVEFKLRANAPFRGVTVTGATQLPDGFVEDLFDGARGKTANVATYVEVRWTPQHCQQEGHRADVVSAGAGRAQNKPVTSARVQAGRRINRWYEEHDVFAAVDDDPDRTSRSMATGRLELQVRRPLLLQRKDMIIKHQFALHVITGSAAIPNHVPQSEHPPETTPRGAGERARRPPRRDALCGRPARRQTGALPRFVFSARAWRPPRRDDRRADKPVRCPACLSVHRVERRALLTTGAPTNRCAAPFRFQCKSLAAAASRRPARRHTGALPRLLECKSMAAAGGLLCSLLCGRC